MKRILCAIAMLVCGSLWLMSPRMHAAPPTIHWLQWYGLQNWQIVFDQDGDGFTAEEEFNWGTDPLDRASLPYEFTRTTNRYSLRIAATPEVLSYLQSSTDFVSWQPVTNLPPATNWMVTFEIPKSDPHRFFRIGVLVHTNSDNDCLLDFEELTLFGTNPSLTDTDGDGINDCDEALSGTDPNYNSPTGRGAISGTVVLDEDSDPATQNHPGLAGWKVFLDLDYDGQLGLFESSAVSQADGSYLISHLDPGIYRVRVETRPGWAQVFPSSSPPVASDGYPDRVVEVFDSGAGPIPFPYGRHADPLPGDRIILGGEEEPVPAEIVTGPLPPPPLVAPVGTWAHLDWLNVPSNCFVTVAFDGEEIIDGPGDDLWLFTSVQQGSSERAEIFLGSTESNLTYAATITQASPATLDLATLAVPQPVRFLKLRGLTTEGYFQGMEVVGFQAVNYRPAPRGHYDVSVAGGQTVSNINFGVIGDDRPPHVFVSLADDDLRAGVSAQITVTASDDVGLSNVTLRANGVVVPLDSNRQGLFTPSSGGLLELFAVATDSAGQTADTLLSAVVRNADGTLPDLSGLPTTGSSPGGPSIRVISPVAGEILDAPRNIVGTISGTISPVTSWQVHYALADLVNPESLADNDPDYVLLNQGAGPVTSAVLGTLAGDTLSPGAYLVRVTATDQNSTTAYFGFVIGVRIDPLDIRPEIVITKPTNETTIMFVTNIVGSVTTRQQLREWYVEYAPLSQVNLQNLSDNTPAWMRIGQGTNSITNGVLAKFDATLVPNDSYVIRVSAWNRNGLGWAEPVVVHVTGNAKLGNFAVEFTDVELPLAGIPITVKRKYESLNATRSGDFGYGWSLAVQDADIAETVPQTGSGLVSTPFRVGTRVYLTAPDGKRIGFTFEAEVGAVSFLGAAYSAVFKPDPGVPYTLSVPEGDAAFLTIGTSGEAALFFIPLPWNPDTYILTDKQGTSYTYDQDDGLIEIKDANGNRVTFTDTAIEHSAGSRVQLARDTAGRITQIVAPDGKTWSYQYNPAGDLVQMTYPGNVIGTFGYATNRAHFLETIDDPMHGPSQRTEYDANGRVIAIIDAAGNRREQTWDTGSFTGTYTDGRGNVTLLTYDARGNLTRQQDPLGGVTTWEYKNTNYPDFETAIVDPRGNRTTYTYDARGNLLQAIYPLGKRTTYTYDEHDRITSKYYNLGGTETFEYDARGNLVHFESPLGRWDITYTSSGLRASVLDGEGGLTRFEYDTALGLPNRIIAPDGSTRQFLLDTAGRVTQYIDQLGNITRFEYDSSGRLVRQIDPRGGEVRTAYDAVFPEKPSAVTNRTGRVTRYTYDSLGRVQEINAPGGSISRYEYDADGNITAVVDPLTNRTEFVYDKMSRLIEETDPLGEKRMHIYDLAGNRTNSVDRNERKRSFSYDALNRVTQERWHNPDDSVLRTITFGYDFLDRVTSASDPDATLRPFWARVPGARPEAEWVTYPGRGEFRVAYTYDGAGRRIQMNSSIGTLGALVLRYTRDVAGHLRIVTSSQPLPPSTLAGNAWQLQLWRNARGDVTELRRFADSTGNAQVSQTFVTNSAACDCIVDSITHVIHTNQPLPDASMTFTRDLEGIITGVLEGTNSFSYGYNAAAQLTSATLNGAAVENYSYDANGNRIASHLHGGYVTGPANRLSQAGVWALSYDKEGNLVTKSNMSSGDVFAFTWDHRNRLTQVMKTNSALPAGSFVTEYRYDPFNRRAAVLHNSVTNWTYYDGNQPIADYVANETNPIRLFAAGEKLDELYAVWTRGQSNFWTLTDHIGSVRRVLAQNGTEIAALSYDSYGNPLSATGTQPNAADRFAFAGREWDSDTRLYYNRARYYDSELGRFISADPIGFEGGDFNLYRYTANRPVSATDPLGTVTAVEYAVLSAAADLGDITAYCALAFGVSDLYHYIVSNVVPALQGRPQPYNPTDTNNNGVPDAVEGVAPGPGDIIPFLDIPQCAKSVSGGLP